MLIMIMVLEREGEREREEHVLKINTEHRVRGGWCGFSFR
jgi:hypothetical protein